MDSSTTLEERRRSPRQRGEGTRRIPQKPVNESSTLIQASTRKKCTANAVQEKNVKVLQLQKYSACNFKTKTRLFYSPGNKQIPKKENRATAKMHVRSVPTYPKQMAR
jgi:hypothetical protein